jgi:hypothetical protein
MFAHYRRKSRGTAIVLGLILSIIVSGMVMTLAFAAGVQTKSSGDLIGVDRAWYAAEAGSQRAAWYIKNNTTVTQPLTGTVNGCSYSATWSTTTGTTKRVTCVGTYGTAQSTVLISVTPPNPVQPSVTVGGSFSLKNVQITGDLIVGGALTFQPGVGSVSGNATYGTTVSGTSSAAGTTSQGTFNGVSWATLLSSLATQAGSNTGTSGTGKTYNFSAISGTNKVIYVNGDVINPRFVGSGTLYVNGKVTIDGGADPGASNPVNIVCTGDLTTNNNIDYHGSLYTQGDWYRGKIQLTGSLYVSGMDQTNNGNSSVTFTSLPWFDTRSANVSSTSTTTFASFAGPRP